MTSTDDVQHRVEPPLRVVVAQIGARRHYAVPRSLHRAGLLHRFCTDLCADVGFLRLAEHVVPQRLRPAPLRRMLARKVVGVPRQRIHCFTGFGIKRTWGRPRSADPDAWRRAHVEANEEFGRLVCRDGLSGASGVYVFNAAGLEILREARRQGMQTVLDQTCAPIEIEENAIREERELWPGWELESESHGGWEPMARREEAEWELTDRIICGSNYVLESIRAASGPVERAVVVPYGVDVERFAHQARRIHDRKLRVLFVGTLDLRKGVPYFWQAAQRLQGENVEFRAVGPLRLAPQIAEELRPFIELVGGVPRSAIVNEYHEADVLIMPTVSEGSANVTYEALAAGLPVITTVESGSVVRDGVDGFVVPIRSSEMMAERIMRLAEDRTLLAEMSAAAAARARQFSWEDYAKRLTAAVRGEIVSVSPSPVTSRP